MRTTVNNVYTSIPHLEEPQFKSGLSTEMENKIGVLPKDSNSFQNSEKKISRKMRIFFKCLLSITIFLLLIYTSYALITRSHRMYRMFQRKTEEEHRRNEMLNSVNDTGTDVLDHTLQKQKPYLSIRHFQKYKSKQCLNVPLELRFDCHPESGASQWSCESRRCCWRPLSTFDKEQNILDTPYCYYPPYWRQYSYLNYSHINNDFSGYMKLSANSFYKKDINIIKVEASSIDSSTLRVKIYDPENKRYEPPWPLRSDPKPFTTRVPDAKYRLDTDKSKFGFNVTRAADGTSIFNTLDPGGFIFADQFLQISALVPSHNIYGLGEHQTHLKLNTNWQLFTLFNRDHYIMDQANLYGSHPFYLMIENSGNCHGVLFLNSNAMDVILQPTPGITFRTIGGIIDIYFFMGPTPENVLQQYSAIVGKPFLPPYWGLGFHLCRYGYGTLEKTKEVWNRTRAAQIPFDVQWNDLDYMERNNDFTYNKDTFKDLPKFVDEIHAVGMHYVPLIDAGIGASEKEGTYPPYDEAYKEGLLIKDGTSNEPIFGKVWNLGLTVWPDFTNPKTPDYYLKMMSDLHDKFAFDGIWIDMNDPSNFYNGKENGCSHNDLDYPPYIPHILDNYLATKTICMNAQHYLGPHYNLHNTYGISQAVASNRALKKIRGKRPFIISRSTWEGQGFYSGHWTGDDTSLWHDMRMSIPDILSYSLFQIPLVGADICGFNGNTTEALCNRWMQLGAFYPFMRNHNTDDAIEQDPVAMGELVVNSTKKALSIRYRLLPYLYTLFYRAHRFGETVARPLFFEFTNDTTTYDIDSQFLWGSGLMIVPVLDEGALAVRAYLPRGIWYDFHTKMSQPSIGEYFTIGAPVDTIPLFIRGGSILPAQEPGLTTTASRRNKFQLIVALDESGMAKGELYWDDGDSLDTVEYGLYQWIFFTVQNQMLSNVDMKKGSFDEIMILDTIEIFGVKNPVKTVLLNNNTAEFDYNSDVSFLRVKNLSVDLKQYFVMSWQDQ
ncbi:lysosomal alpha-glucosidase [Orussus abietinus]|uniref:lysosomal alpha-glucosidase n=1 Tax=Orussus abietinus TaxID=222816 RepID=UPI00062538AE|nr:lysosomal alpha-glucosidase [Orussus abietinus]